MNNYLLLVDTSEAETVDELTLKANNVSGMIIRMNNIQGGHHLDANFTTQWKEAGDADVLRIPYFIYSPWVDGQANFEWFVKHMPYEASAAMVEVDVAFPGYSPVTYAAQLDKFCQLVTPRWHLMIHANERSLPLLNIWPANADYWWADYPASLNPATQEQQTWGQVRASVDALDGPLNLAKVPGRLKMWQVSKERLILPGSIKPIDVNVYSGTVEELKTWINEKPPIPDHFVEEHTQPFDGVELHQVRRYNSHCFITIIDPNGKRFLVTPFGHKQVSSVARELGAQLVINGGDYGAAHATGLHASKGKVYQAIIPYQPWVNLTADNKPQINAYNSTIGKYNALAGKRFIVLDGKISSNTSASWKEVHPRTLVGVTQDGKLIECVVDGRQGPNNIGVDLYDGARIMIEFGAWKAIDMDGGGSSTMWVNDRVINSPIDNAVPGLERFVGTHIAMFVDGVAPPPPPQGDYIVVAPVKPRLTPSLFQIITKSNLPVGTVFNSTTTQVVTERIPPFVGQDFTITWVQMPDGYWVPKFYKIEYVKDNVP